MKITNVLFVRRGDEILLAMKKRGFGAGKWNGVGGKVQEGENMSQAMVRETKEEIGIDIQEQDLQKVGELEFYFPEKEGWDIYLDVFFTYKWAGEPIETEEMKPKWFSVSDIPLDQMWIDDKFWLPGAIDGKKFKAKCYFKGEGEEVKDFKIDWVEGF